MHVARKRFGQHFLHDPGVIERIVRAIDPKAEDRMVEIGPGLGAITLPLLRHLPQLDAVEIDRDAIRHLTEASAGHCLRIHEADVLEFDFGSLRTDSRQLRVVGNLPYNISTPLLFHLIEQREQLLDMHFMLQKEAVDRMAAGAGDEIVTVHVQALYVAALDRHRRQWLRALRSWNAFTGFKFRAWRFRYGFRT